MIHMVHIIVISVNGLLVVNGFYHIGRDGVGFDAPKKNAHELCITPLNLSQSPNCTPFVKKFGVKTQ